MEQSNPAARFRSLQSHLHAYNHAMGVLSYDGVTGAPRMSAEGRATTLGILSADEYELKAGSATEDLLCELKEHASELSPVDRRALELFCRDRELVASIPKAEYIAYQELLVRADDVWHTAKSQSDFAAFAPYLRQIFETNVRIAGYYRPNDAPYDVLLSMYERGLTTKTLDSFFAAVRAELVPLIGEIGRAPQPRRLFPGVFPVEKQRILSDKVMEIMGIDRARCSIGETEHPFTTEFNRNDVRITTHYYDDNYSYSLFSVIHEGGHALYELGGGEEYQGTVVAGGVSMGIHESQSRLYENMIGRSREFVEILRPILAELFPAEAGGLTAEELYREFNRCEPSLIRTEADEITYPLHIMIRYDIERALISGDLSVSDLPAAWADKTKEYLGITVPDDKHGVLQDSHWSGGMIGYFPSYAIGSAYAAQIVNRMERDLSLTGTIASGSLRPVTDWLTDHIYRHASMYDPKELFESAVGAAFDPTYYTRYLTEKFRGVYGI